MPTYTYECKKCGAQADLFHSMSAAPRVKCARCGGATIRLLGTGSGVIFKGSGFYETDYKTKIGNSEEGIGKEGTKSDASKSDAKSEGKSEGKAEGKAEGKGEEGSKKSEVKSEVKSETKSESKGEGKRESKGESKGRDTSKSRHSGKRKR
jgi:putative FmdB family regulatory protein